MKNVLMIATVLVLGRVQNSLFFIRSIEYLNLSRLGHPFQSIEFELLKNKSH